MVCVRDTRGLGVDTPGPGILEMTSPARIWVSGFGMRIEQINNQSYTNDKNKLLIDPLLKRAP